MILIRSTVCLRATARTSSRGAAPNTSPVSRGGRPGSRHHSTSEAMPFCATRVTQERRSAGIVAEPGQLVVHPSDGAGGQRTRRAFQPPERRLARRRAVAHPAASRGQRVTRERVGGEWTVSIPPEGSPAVTRPRDAPAATAPAVAGGRWRPRRVVAASSWSTLLGVGRADALRRRSSGWTPSSAGRSTPATTAAVALNDLLAGASPRPGCPGSGSSSSCRCSSCCVRPRAWWTAAWVVDRGRADRPAQHRWSRRYFGRVRPRLRRGRCAAGPR